MNSLMNVLIVSILVVFLGQHSAAEEEACGGFPDELTCGCHSEGCKYFLNECLMNFYNEKYSQGELHFECKVLIVKCLYYFCLVYEVEELEECEKGEFKIHLHQF
jgi:hypothetical protein